MNSEYLERLGHGMFPQPSGKCCISWLTSVSTGQICGGVEAQLEYNVLPRMYQALIPSLASAQGLEKKRKPNIERGRKAATMGRQRRGGTACRQQLVITEVCISTCVL